jgi:beta-lactamase regulating signal transducer with metallopeptidase domain
MVNDLLSMAAAGSVIFLLWLALYPLTRERFSARWHYCALKVVLFFLLFPIRPFLRLWTHLAAFFAPATTFQTESTIAGADLPAVVLPAADIASELPQPAPSLSLTTADLKLLVILWTAGAAVLLAYKLTAFIRFRRRLFRCCNGQISQETEAVFHACRTELGIQRQVRLLCAPHIQTPLVTGLWRPTVILPDGDFSQDELRYIFLHELTHVKSHDLWVRAAALAAMVIHWYDPLVYLLAHRIQTLSEQSCDERVAKPLTHQERYAYGKTILKVAADVTAGTATFAVPMSMRRILERRLMRVLHPKFMSKKRTLVAGFAAVALVVCGTAVALSAEISVQADETEPAPLEQAKLDYQRTRAIYIFNQFGLNEELYDYAWSFEAWKYISTDDYRTIIDSVVIPVGATSPCYFISKDGNTVYYVFQDTEAVNYMYVFTLGDEGTLQLSDVQTKQDVGRYQDIYQSFSEYQATAGYSHSGKSSASDAQNQEKITDVDLPDFITSELPDDKFGGLYYDGDTLVVNIVGSQNTLILSRQIAQQVPTNADVEYRTVTYSLAELESIKDFLTGYMYDYNISMLDANEVTNQVDVFLKKYDTDTIDSIRAAVMDYSGNIDYLNFIDRSGITVKSTVAYAEPDVPETFSLNFDAENTVGVQDEPVCFTESLYDGSHWYGDTTIGNSVPSDMTFVCENVIYQDRGAIVVAGTARKTSANLSAEVYRLCDGEWESVGVYSDISGYNGLFSFSQPIDADGDYGIKIWHDLPNVNMDIACNVIY